jgi:hypothetical protein
MNMQCITHISPSLSFAILRSSSSAVRPNQKLLAFLGITLPILGCALFAPTPAHAQGLTYTTIYQQGWTASHLYAINDSGAAVGDYADGSAGHGLLYVNGSYTTIDGPLSGQDTIAFAINNAGQILVLNGPIYFLTTVRLNFREAILTH